MRRTVVLALLLAACSSRGHGKTVRVAAAADLERAFDELAAAFEKKTGITPVIDFGSSGLLSKQISQGAPYYLFAAANADYVDQAVESGRCDATTRNSYARGRVVVWCPSGVAPPVKLADLADPRFKRIAIANPEHAPYGMAAKQALIRAGIWDQLQDKLVLGDNVQITMQYARDHTVDASLVALSLAVVTDGGSFLPIDTSQYDPLDQQLVVCGNGPEADYARRLAAYIGSPDGRELMARYGFHLPDETPRFAPPSAPAPDAAP
ncbi:MAG TPA: molybdate ABC transporter substrate-binding protein [Kofleriaceae bacterium]|nr:molybdate ABC transporter substrate-binding protein [Kofleriaceae bacterium]